MRISASILIAVLAASCSGGEKPTFAPRPEAYPRPTLYSPAYIAADSLPLHLELNAEASTSAVHKSDGSVWLDIAYPAYGFTVYCTLSQVTPATIDDAIANRIERIGLNLGEGSAHAVETFVESESGFEGTVVTSFAAGSTPVQFIATDSKGWLVSGAAFTPSPQANPDSIRPYVEALERDILHALSTLSHETPAH